MATAQWEPLPGILIGRNLVAIRISKDDGAPERTIERLLDDGDALCLRFGIQLINMVAVQPNRYAPSWIQLCLHALALDKRRAGCIFRYMAKYRNNGPE